MLSCIRLIVTLWTVAVQAPLSKAFPRQEHWNGLPFPPPGDLPDPGMEPESPASPALAGGFSTTELPGKPERLNRNAINMRFPRWCLCTEPGCQCRRQEMWVRGMNSIPGWGRALGEGHGNPLQYSCLEKPMDKGACWATVHRVAQSRTRLRRQQARH